MIWLPAIPIWIVVGTWFWRSYRRDRKEHLALVEAERVAQLPPQPEIKKERHLRVVK